MSVAREGEYIHYLHSTVLLASSSQHLEKTRKVWRMIENSNARSKSRDKRKKKLIEEYLFSVRGDGSGMAEIRLSKECCHTACHRQHAKKDVYEVVDYSWRFLQAQRRQRCNPCKRNQTRNRTGLWRQKQAIQREKNLLGYGSSDTEREREKENCGKFLRQTCIVLYAKKTPAMPDAGHGR